MKKHQLHPESLMMSFGYNPKWSEGAVKCPIFQTSTFVFESAEAGKDFFELAYGLREAKTDDHPGLIYSRLNNPDLEILENRLTLWDQAEDAAVFEFLKPGDLLLHSSPLYGGTDHFVNTILPKFGVEVMSYFPSDTFEDLRNRLELSGKAKQLAMIYIETPANPTNTMIDIRAMRRLADLYSSEKHHVLVAVDNTYMGPIWQHPLRHGADLIMYSATKYIGGHSDLIAGAVLGNVPLLKRIKKLRTFLGNMASPYTGWLLMRSLETLKARMDIQTSNAQKVAEFLAQHSKVKKVLFPGLLTPADGRQYRIYKEQCNAPGAMIALEIEGSEPEAFEFLNALKLIKLAVSLGSTESLVQHPATMTHAGVDPVSKVKMGITSGLVRLSIGVEHPDDLIFDLQQALEQMDAQMHIKYSEEDHSYADSN